MTHDMWFALKNKFGVNSTTKLCILTVKFDTFKKRANVSMCQNLLEMSNMNHELHIAGYILTYERQAQAMNCSSPSS